MPRIPDPARLITVSVIRFPRAQVPTRSGPRVMADCPGLPSARILLAQFSQNPPPLPRDSQVLPFFVEFGVEAHSGSSSSGAIVPLGKVCFAIRTGVMNNAVSDKREATLTSELRRSRSGADGTPVTVGNVAQNGTWRRDSLTSLFPSPPPVSCGASH